MTFSIAGVCSRTGEIGMALTTSSMAAGARAMRLAPGYGAVFAQARSDPRLSALGVGLLEAGQSARATLDAMVASTSEAEWRQLGVIDAAGRTAHMTGERCVAPRGGAEAPGALALGNGLGNEAVVPAILQGFLKRPGDGLAERLLTALDHGLAAGGEPYPLRSAALLISRPGVPFPVMDLRVDLHDTPLAALRFQWEQYAPLLEGYLARAIDPAHAPLAASFEGHLRHPVKGF